MSNHDKCCPLDGPALECAVCEAIAAARSEEKRIFTATWKANIGPVTQRAYERGYQDAANGRSMDWTRW